MGSQLNSAIAFFDKSGGVNTAFAASTLADNEMVDCENFSQQDRGGLERRSGYQTLISGDTPSGQPILGLYQFRLPSASHYLKVQNSKIWSSTGSTWTDITGSVVVDAADTSTFVWQTFKKQAVGTNSVNPPVKWSGTGNATAINRTIAAGPDTVDAAYTLVRHRERIILGDFTETVSSVQTRRESSIYPSDAGTLDTWSLNPVGRIHIDEGDGDSITNLQDALGYLVVFKQGSLHRVSNLGASSTQERVRVANIGTPGKHTALVRGALIYFLDRTGRLWVYDVRGGDNPDALVELTRNKLGKKTLDTFDTSLLHLAHLVHDPIRDQILCFVKEI